ncbi:50S ribosomal L9 C-terminal domain-containing protein, partial [Aphanothece stagnina]|uniref:50S ribosomal L9 C-terminal domain-containing protein n=1 Tax=Aphanothece stagnina TaxID=1004305 RepID=UPI00398F5125
AKLAADLAATKASAEAMRDRINGKTVKIEGNVGRDGVRLFGAVTSENIAEAVKAQLGETVEKKQVVLVNPIKRLGRFYVELDMHRQVDMHITVHVFDPANPDLDEPVASTEVEEDEATEEPADEA